VAGPAQQPRTLNDDNEKNERGRMGMGKAWRSAGAMKQLATALLALALAGIALTYTASHKAVDIQGPGALRAVDAGTAWLGVNEELWILDAAGRRTGVRQTRDFGFTEGISNIVPAPDGQVLLTSRGDLQWQLVDRATLARVRSITPQWPAEFRDKELRAIHLAVAPDGDVAVATGGGHAVLLFDREGRYKARTRPAAYRFTNGLWWTPQGWWTTDTNRFVLRLLDAGTLAEKEAVPLARQPVGYPYLAEAIASQGSPLAAGGAAPFATLTRVGYLMEPGHVVDVFPDGTQVVFNQAPFAQLRDISWFDGRLLAVDGATFTVQRFAADRTAAAPFGDAQVRAALQRMHDDRIFWGTLGSRYAFLVSAFLLLAGIGAYARHRRLAALAVVAAREGGRTAAQAAPLKDLARQRLRIYGLPLAVRLAIACIVVFVVFPWLRARLLGPQADDVGASLRLLLLCVLVPLVPVLWWQQRRHARLAADPQYEPALNHRAIDWLRAGDDFDRIKLEGEIPRETVFIIGGRPRWLLVTNRRILLFVASARERRLVSEWPRRSVVYAGPPEHMPGGEQPLWRRLLLAPANLGLAFTTGTRLRLRCASTATARRVGELLMASPAIPEDDVVPDLGAPRVRRRWHEVLASFLVPGTGQWLQGRFATGVVLFTAATLLAVYEWVPVAWALHGPKMEVSPLSVASALATWLTIALVASSDAWAFSTARR
jgi:hypothetical protein